MTPSEHRRFDRALRDYVEAMVADMGRPERRRAMGWYVTGLLLDGERKSIEPMAARLVDSPTEIEAMRQRLQQCVTISSWSDEELYARLARKLDRELPGIEAFVLDDTGFPKKGKHSVGVMRQYSGTLGRVDNCQVAVSLHLAGETGSGCIGMRLFLPESWATDASRRAAVGVPNEVVFKKKWEIALGEIDDALRWGVRKHLLLADAGYGDASEFREGLTARGIQYVVGVQGNHRAWPPGSEPAAPVNPPGKHGRPRTYWSTDEEPALISELALKAKYRKVTWREGSKGKQSSRFAAIRVVPAENYRRGKAKPPAATHWLLCEWPEGKKEPTKYHLSDLPANTSIVTLVRMTKLRWRVERDYQEMKQEIGLDHFEGRTWRGFHHHATLCAVAHGFLALQRALFPPEDVEMDPAGSEETSSADLADVDRDLPDVQAPSI
jgi:SRSO17 transposase